jgi:hypothetical protein
LQQDLGIAPIEVGPCEDVRPDHFQTALRDLSDLLAKISDSPGSLGMMGDGPRAKPTQMISPTDTCCRLAVFLFLVYTDSAALNDPKFAGELLLCHSSDECPAKIFEIMMRHRLGRPENSNARVL